VTDAMMMSMEVEYEITHRLSVGTVTLDLGWPWTILDLGHRIFASNISNTERDNVGCNGGQIGNHLWTCDCHDEHWPWM